MVQSTLKKKHPARPALGVSLLVGTSFLTLSLLSYHPEDPSWSFQTTAASSIQNWGGLVGSWAADLLLQAFGLVAYLAVIASLMYGWRCLSAQVDRFDDRSRQQVKGRHWRLGTSVALSIICLSGLISLFDWKIYSEIPAGGIVGFLVASAGSFAFSSVGSGLFFVGGLWLSLVLISDRFALLPESSLLAQAREKLSAFPRPQFSKLSSFLAFLKPSFLRRNKATSEKAPELGRKLDDLFKTRAPVKKEMPFSASSSSKEETPAPKEEEDKTSPSLFGKALSLPLFGASNEPGKRELLVKEAPKRKRKPKVELGDFEAPGLELLEDGPQQNLDISRDELIENSKALEQKLLDFGIAGQVIDIRPGPIITLYEFEPAPGVKVKNILNLTDDLKMAMKALSIRILAPIPGKAAVGIEIPNARRETVFLKDLLRSQLFDHSSSPMTMALGKTTSGEAYVADLSKMPHLLIAGATGSGKSVGLNSIIVSMLYKASPEELKFIMIDPKMLELSLYEGIPHLLLPVVTDPKRASRALQWAVREMERRYKLISSLGARNLKSYNEKVEKLSHEELEKEIEEAAKAEASASALIEEESKEAELPTASQDSQDYVKLPNICIVIDELADLVMVASREVEESIARLAQMARAAGIHLIVATQRPSVDVLTGVIKANFPTRIAYQVASKVDSRTIIDGSGAENLIGDGDMLFLPPGTSRLERLHGPFISDDEISRIVGHLKSQGEADYSSSINLDEQEESGESNSVYEELDDELYDSALQVVFETQSPSASMLQRRLRIGYNRAARLIERMEAEGIVSAPQAGGKGRELLIESSADYS